MDNRREQIIEIIKREFIGPDPLNESGMVQDNGEEILSSDPPRIRYIAGILFPQEAREEQVAEGYEPEIIEQDDAEEGTVREELGSGKKEYLQDAEELMNLSNAYKQSAMSMTVAIKNGDTVFVSVAAGRYKTVKEKRDNGSEADRYYRQSIKWNNDDKPLELTEKGISPPLSVMGDDGETDLKFHSTFRYREKDCLVYTFTLENSKVNASGVRDEDCYFQVGFSVVSTKGFLALPEKEKLNLGDEDYLSNQMLYRDIKSYGIGHGCAVDWNEAEGLVKEISTTVFPEYEIKPIVPSVIEGISLEMYKLSDAGQEEEIIKTLSSLCGEYEKWIERLERRIPEIADRGTALRHVENCKECLKRMENGVLLLKNNEKVMRAFQLMNKAMLLQQLHYNMPLQEWSVGKDGSIVLETPEPLPDINERHTWGRNKDRIGKWRPFQLAFVLINLESMQSRESAERDIVDLIWFPTGGGKTEAYLGLSAYTIFIRRLNNKEDSGTTILMRYTLRLLTAQQYERAAAMICACEIIRKESEDELGSERISIGLWVGGETSPNSMKDAVKAYDKMYRGESGDHNPFIVLKCPWCGAQMGYVGKGHTPGYKKKKTGAKKMLVMQCSNTSGGCDYSKDGFELPLYIVDDDVYEKTPTLLLGTVDKFAMLPYRPEAQTIFGIRDGKRITMPDLIIQDELHLISGPLGSMVGHYETMIHELSSIKQGDKTRQPKVIASTATISRAAEQCHALYGCGKDNVKQFPPAGLDAGDSFFAIEDKTSEGRKYVGILAAGSPSMATTTIRMYAALLYAGSALEVENESERDPYWTIIGYFNSIRELGQTETWIRADIDEYLHVIYKRRYEDQKEGYRDRRRYIYEDKELTSRVRSDKIPSTLQELSITYPTEKGEKRPVDICLATNMISVGVDVPRLGLMAVSGQPKTTSEYIQATSRVGRSSSAPGLVFTLYNPGKPRDKSHYEQFIPYHSRVYCHVEPTSVTPFSAPLRERALHALIIGMMRLEADKDFNNNPPSIPDEKTIKRIRDVIMERINMIDPDELDATMKHFDSIIQDWERWEPEKYQDFNNGEILPLMFPAGTMRNEAWGKNRGFPTPTSMRSVDTECEARVLENGYTVEEE